MEQTTIFTATLGLIPPWRVISARFSEKSNRLDIDVEYARVKEHDCPLCGGKGTGCTTEMLQETWFHENFFRYATYLHARVPMVVCHCGGAFRPERPWCRPGSNFCRVLPPSR